jgi:crotonobetainyl-CoA:carnitine CoA-transferase CaiB-like acyl-CoA transferase
MSPLDGLRVIDLTTFLSGPYGTQILADLGADVVKVESPAGDSSRGVPPYIVDGDSAYFHAINRGKRSVVADMKTADGVDFVRALADQADVLVENYRPGVLARLGITYADVAARNPGIVWCSISGFGQDGPYQDRPAYDMIVQAMSGGMSLTGERDGPPVRSGIPLGDLTAGLYAVIGILGVLHQRNRTGLGEQIDIAMLDCQISMLSYQGAYHLLGGAQPGRQGRGHDSIPTYRAFTAGDGADVMVTANTERMWVSLCEVLGLAELPADPRFGTLAARQANRRQLDPLLEKAFRERTAAEWMPLLQAARIPAAPVNTVAEALADPQVRHRGMVLDLPAEGDRPALRLLGNPVRIAGTGQLVPRRPPRLGEHLNEVTADWLRRTDKKEAS